MNKELLELLGKNIRYKKEYVGNDTYRLYIKKNEIELLENYLTELEQTKNANPSEALKSLEELRDYLLRDRINISSTKNYNIIEQALLKAQEQEKVLEIIKEKLVDMFKLYNCKTVEEYNDSQYRDCKLTYAEYELLKRWLDEITRVKD